MRELFAEAIEKRLVIEFRYNGSIRHVEPHCLGEKADGELRLRAYQIKGEESADKIGFKLFDLAKVSDCKMLAAKFQRPRPGYKVNDSVMALIIAQL